jgi:hypothetical protein
MLQTKARIGHLMHLHVINMLLANTIPTQINMRDATIGLEELTQQEEIIAPEALFAKIEQHKTIHFHLVQWHISSIYRQFFHAFVQNKLGEIFQSEGGQGGDLEGDGLVQVREEFLRRKELLLMQDRVAQQLPHA